MVKILRLLLCLWISPALAGGFSGDAVGNAGFAQYPTASSPAGNMTTPVFGNITWGSAASVFFGPLGSSSSNSSSTSATNRRIPIPIAGTLKGAECYQTTANTTAAIVSNVNGTDGATTCSFASAQHASYTGAGDTVAAGDLFQWHLTGTFAASALYTQSFLFVGTGQNGMLLGGAYNTSTGTTGTVYQAFGGNFIISSEITAATPQPSAYTVNGLYEIPNGTENTVPHVFNVFLNGAAVATPVTCTNLASASTGCCVDVSPTGKHVGGSGGPSCTSMTAFHVSPGDTLSVQEVCASTCVAINPGISLAITPDVTNQAPIVAMSNSNWTGNAWISPSDNQIVTSQTNFQIIPHAPTQITFSGMIACTTAITGAGAGRTVTAQTGSTGSAPTNVASGPVVAMLTTGGTACPGAAGSTNPTLLLAGGQDFAHTFTAVAGQTIDYGLTVTATPGSNAILKTGMVAVVN